MPITTVATDWRQAVTWTQVDNEARGGAVKVGLFVEGGSALEVAAVCHDSREQALPSIELYVGSEWGRPLGLVVQGSYSTGGLLNPPYYYGRVRTIGCEREVWLNPGENLVCVVLRVQYPAIYAPVNIHRRLPPRSVSTGSLFR